MPKSKTWCTLPSTRRSTSRPRLPWEVRFLTETCGNMTQRTKTPCHVWKLWFDKYVLSLHETTQTHLKAPRIQSTTQPAKGDIVLLKESSPRGTWRLGIIEKLITSKNGEVLACTVGTVSGKLLNRALNFLRIMDRL